MKYKNRFNSTHVLSETAEPILEMKAKLIQLTKCLIDLRTSITSVQIDSTQQYVCGTYNLTITTCIIILKGHLGIYCMIKINAK
mgnify:CR=1 FL=1